jgi:peptide/nickel transport system ATP-binding protein
MLELQGVSFRYGEKYPWLFRGLDLTVEAGEIVGISGDSGAGKTTLARLVSGYLRPAEGTVLADGAPLPERGYCPVQLALQHPELAFNPRWKVKKILAEVEGFFPDQKLLDDLGVDGRWLERFPHELSGGELQRIAVARLLNPLTRYLWADELTSMLDAVTQAQIWNAVAAWSRANNAGVAAISHDLSLLEAVCDRRVDLFPALTVDPA